MSLLKSVTLSLCLLLGFSFFQNASLYAQKPPTKVSLGIRPDLLYFGDGVRAATVSKDKPGSKAGMKPDDILLAIDGKNIGGLVQYRDLLNTYKPGDKVTLTIKRKGKKIQLQAEFK